MIAMDSHTGRRTERRAQGKWFRPVSDTWIVVLLSLACNLVISLVCLYRKPLDGWFVSALIAAFTSLGCGVCYGLMKGKTTRKIALQANELRRNAGRPCGELEPKEEGAEAAQEEASPRQEADPSAELADSIENATEYEWAVAGRWMRPAFYGAVCAFFVSIVSVFVYNHKRVDNCQPPVIADIEVDDG